MSPLGSKNLFTAILSGFSPSLIFNDILSSDSNMDKYAIADRLVDEFPNLDSKVLNVVWGWKSIKSTRGISDNELDDLIRKFLTAAGYKI